MDLKRKQKKSQRTIESDAMASWSVGVSLLGAGAERLEAGIKRTLVAKLITLSCLIADDWTRETARIDFKNIKRDLLEDEAEIAQFMKSEGDIAEAKRTIAGLVDVLEFMILVRPFTSVVGGLAEEARDNVLAESIVNAEVAGDFEKLVKSFWLADIDTPRGARLLSESIKNLPKARFLRVALAGQLITRAYWRHWKKENRLKLLEVAEESLKAVGLEYDKAGLQRLIQREQQDDAKDEEE